MAKNRRPYVVLAIGHNEYKLTPKQALKLAGLLHNAANMISAKAHKRK